MVVLLIVVPRCSRRRSRSLQMQTAHGSSQLLTVRPSKLVSPRYSRQEVAPTQGRGRSSPTK